MKSRSEARKRGEIFFRGALVRDVFLTEMSSASKPDFSDAIG
ncbi:MAG: hypothetical protein OXG97_16970 [Candidatus Poribacteria bacterium]|nr:hypothetical protein [Candidatus Poribacteria bacterium]